MNMANQNSSARGNSPLMTEDELIAVLRRIRFTPQRDRQARRGMRLTNIAAEAGVSTTTIYHIIRGGRASMDSLDRIATVVQRMLEQGAYSTLRPLFSAGARSAPQTQNDAPKS